MITILHGKVRSIENPKSDELYVKAPAYKSCDFEEFLNLVQASSLGQVGDDEIPGGFLSGPNVVSIWTTASFPELIKAIC